MTVGSVGSAYQSETTKNQYQVTADVPFDDNNNPLPHSKEFEQKLIALFTEYIPKFLEDEKAAQ